MAVLPSVAEPSDAVNVPSNIRPRHCRSVPVSTDSAAVFVDDMFQYQYFTHEDAVGVSDDLQI